MARASSRDLDCGIVGEVLVQCALDATSIGTSGRPKSSHSDWHCMQLIQKC